jgi:UDP-2,3-diacylglucosamine pyrophosphatase LpxH
MKEKVLFIRKILSLAKNGTEITYVVGNHDDFLRDFIPLTVHENIKIVNECIWRDYLITHGDLYDETEVGNTNLDFTSDNNNNNTSIV